MVVGTNKIFCDADSITYLIENWIYHEMYDPESQIYDIGLIRVTKDIMFNTKVLPIQLDTVGDSTVVNKEVTLVGFGVNNVIIKKNLKM